jgi:3-oxoacyl-[acyl-carrier protein] reductase
MDLPVVNAGVGTAGPIESSSMRRFDKTVAVNLRAPLLLMQASLPMLRAAARSDPERGARVVALSSITGVFAEPDLAVYGSTKAALLSLVDTFNAEEARHGVVATAIAPGFVDTDMSTWAHGTVGPDQMLPVQDIVEVVDMLTALTPRTMIGRVMARSGSSGFQA